MPTTAAVAYVVDDEAPIRAAFELLLRGRGIVVRTFASADAFLQAFRHDWQGCVFADVRMPDMSGTDLYAELLKRNSELTVVLMTGHGTADSLKQLLGRDVILLEKPFSADSIMKILERCGPASSRAGG